jgi:uracil-DNA glycosylase family 4
MRQNLFGDHVSHKGEVGAAKRHAKKVKREVKAPVVIKNLFGQSITSTGDLLGCTRCPLNKQPNTKKIIRLDQIKGRRAMLWAQSPGKRENELGKELQGASGDLLWEATGQFGMGPEFFDIQNVVRCQPRDEDGDNRDPTKRELLCCSVYNGEALERNEGRAKVHIVLGDIAAKQLLGSEYKKDHPVFWYKKWGCYVVRNRHPAYFLHKGQKAGVEYYAWRDRFRAVAAILDHPGRWGYLKSRDYTVVRTLAQFDEMEKEIRKQVAEGRRVSFDIEDDRRTDEKHRLLLAGFGTGQFVEKQPDDKILYFESLRSGSKPNQSWKGKCYTVVLDHPEARYEPSHLKALQDRTCKLIEDHKILKSLQNGSYDGAVVKKTIGAELRGYEYDTQYGTFLRYSFLRSCSLENLTYLFFPEFCDYKDIVEEWEGGKYGPHFADAPLEKLTLRNLGDCDVTQRLEQRFRDKRGSRVIQHLVEIYIHAAKTLDLMEDRGPLLDRPNWEKAMEAVPAMITTLDAELRMITNNESFDADSPYQVAHYLYDVLKLPETAEAGRSTNKTVMEYLQATCDNPKANIAISRINRRRVIGRLWSTYLKGFKTSADLYNDELHTIWWLTGTVTGRLRSGKGDRAEAEGILNMQNLANNPLLQNLVISDKNWRRALATK